MALRLTSEFGTPTLIAYPTCNEEVTMPKIVDWEARFEKARAEAPECGCGCGERMIPTEKGLARWKTLGGTKYPQQGTKYLAGHQNRNAPHTLTPEEYQVIVGSVFGDGCLHRKRETYAPVFVEGHGLQQEEYLRWKGVQLAALGVDYSYYTNTEGAYRPGSKGVRLRTRANTCLTPILESRYPEPTEELVFSLEPLGLAVWFMDDGTTGKGCDRVALCTNGRSYEALLRIQKMFRDKFGLDTGLNKAGWSKAQDRQQYIVAFRGDSRQKFIDLVAPHIHPTMEYKLQWRNQPKLKKA